MILSLSERMTVPGLVEELDVPLDCEDFRYQGLQYGFMEKPPMHVRITNQNKKRILVEGNAVYTLSVPCSRCLESVAVRIPVDVHVSLDFNREETERAAEFGEAGFLNGYDLDVDSLVTDEILLQFPAKVLCGEDCRGICPKCGKNLNQGECGCDRDPVDPRMAAIQDIFQNFKEV